jgi:4-hydroxyphenylpyruvate dioxygenase
MCRELRDRIGDALTPEEYEAAEELGIMADRSGEGMLLQIFTGALGDRPTFFFEIIQRKGCMKAVSAVPPLTPSVAQTPPTDMVEPLEVPAAHVTQMVQVPGCGGFGKGNVQALYASMEKYDERLKEDSDYDTSEIAVMSP